VVRTVHARADGVAIASAEIAQGNQDLASRTESAASALEETAAAMEQLGSTVAHNADHARSADQLTREAQRVVTEGGQAVREVVQTMQGIDASSQKIADIIGVIDGIAFQTNILALNAAVEAARAGEHGRGFAVVAGEVRSLAQRSAEAAKEIKQLITASVSEIHQGNARAARAGETMDQAITEIQKVTRLITDISHASAEQSNGVAQVGEAVSNMDQTTQQNAAMVEEMAGAAESLRQQSDELVRAVSVFRLQGGSAPAAPRPAPLPPKAQAPAPARPAAAPLHPAPRAPALTKEAVQEDWESF
jgi:methyl-accepting chemotaxis protein-2 (aspartate sensor receptor)